MVDCFGSLKAADEAYRLVQASLLQRPDRGDVIPGAGGLRKMRWSARGHGKSGGIRVLYQWVPEFDTFLMMAAYAKGDVEDLSTKERAVLATCAEAYIEGLRNCRRRPR